jgi:hypothetical protein
MLELKSSLLYSFHLIFHPFDGFWDLKHEKRGSMKGALFILFLVTLTYILQRQFTGFIFNYNQLNQLNIFLEIISVVVPFLLWCISNWCLTTLMDGEGSFSDIVITTAYALVPIVIINLPMILFSNFIVIEEQAFYFFFNSLAVVWSAALIVLGTMTVHQYSMMKTIITCILIIVGMGLIVFIFLLFFSLAQQMFGYFITIYRELTFRL